MFKKDISAGAKSKLKSSIQRGIRGKILSTYPLLTPYIDEILPKKSQLDLIKLPDRISLYALGADPLFFQHMDDALLPALRLVHRFPGCWAKVRVDRGAIRFVLSGATLMVPGLTSKGGWLPPVGGGRETEEGEGGGDAWDTGPLERGEPVVVEAEGKEEACMVGVLAMSTNEMREKGKGVAVEGGHYLGDGLWRLQLD
ncbi:MAG: translation machinery-associated protein 20 [Thelocarpon superellum]|nr:MAG: translation machinery-associated protein 20 [Thelocarpon superellum]